MVMQSDRPIARQTRPTTHRPHLDLAIDMQIQLTYTSISVEGAIKRGGPEHLVWSRGMGKSDKYRLRHLASQVVVEIVCSLSQRQGMLLAGMGG